jgi:hypothetical protein
MGDFDSKGAPASADPLIFEETHAAADHVVVQLTIQGIFPAKFQKPAAYLLAACRKQFASLLLHAYAHDHFAVFVCADATAADRVRTFASDLLAHMREDSKTFHLRLDGIGALDKGQVTRLAARLGQLQTVSMMGARTELYGDYAFITTKAPHAWRWPQRLHYRIYGVELEARLSLAPAREAAADNAKRNSPTGGRAAGDGWQAARTKPRVAKTEPCRDFARGVCARGDRCIFRHSGPKAQGTGNGSGAIHAKKVESTDPCRDFRRGQCARDRCKFVHAGDNNTPHKSPATAAATATALGSGLGSGAEMSGAAAAAGLAASPPTASGGLWSEQALANDGDIRAGLHGARAAEAQRGGGSLASAPPSPSAPTSPIPRRRRRRCPSDDDREESPPSSPTNSRSRSRSWPADEEPTPSTPRSAWLKPLKLGAPAALSPLLGRKRRLAQTPPPPPAAQLAAPLVGAGTQAP